MQNWIVACIVALAVIYLLKRFSRSLKKGKTPECGCTEGCAGCQTSSTCDTLSELKDD